MAATLLNDAGHQVVLHARNEARAAEAAAALPNAHGVVVGDLSSIRGMTEVAEAANATGPFDAVIHNAGVSNRESRRIETEDGLSHVLAINALAPYVLTAVMAPAQRLVYVASGLHRNGDSTLEDLNWADREWDAQQAYSDSKLYNVLLSCAVARLRPDVFANSVEPGWVATKMGGPSAPDDLGQGPTTQAWLAVGEDVATQVSGYHFYHQVPAGMHPDARNREVQDALLAQFAALSGVTLR
jgi:NAD(P)-dependent dehydrogenase (short-subunit alcohol dehydrogenase family)